MSVKWDFKIELEDTNIWKSVEKEVGSSIPRELKVFIEANNAASPDKERLLINNNERIFESVLSFNEKEIEASTFKAAYRSLGIKSLIPFAIDPFGNFYAYSLENGHIIYYHHEEEFVEDTGYTLSEMIEKLY